MMDTNMLKRLKSSSPGEAELLRTKIDDLPEVLLVEILCRLPSNKLIFQVLLVEILCRLPSNKLIFQCKLVSKPWYNLISAPSFVGRYLCLQRQMQNPILTTLILFDMTDPISLIITSDHPVFKTAAGNFTLNFLPCYHQITQIEELAKEYPWSNYMVEPGSVVPPVVIGTYNDLVLCCATKHYQRHYYLCNPYTRQWVPLPPTPGVYHRSLVAFDCDPYYKYSNDDHNGDEEQGTSTTTRTNSFILNAEYKWRVVRLVPNSSDPNFHFEIFSSETRQWREIVVVCSRPFSSFFSDVFFLIGKTTSSVAYNGMLYLWCHNDLILELDLSKSNTVRYRCIEPPEDFSNGNGGRGWLGVSRGRLRLCMDTEFLPRDHDEVLLPFRVRELKQVAEGSQGKLKWLADRVTIDRKDIEVPNPNTIWVLAFHPNNEDVVYLSLYRKIITCNLRGGMLETTTESPIKGVETNLYYPFSLPWWPTPVPKTLE